MQPLKTNCISMKILLVLVSVLIIISCSKTNYDSGRQKTAIPVSVKALKEIISSDTLNNKAIIFFDPYCMPCQESLATDYFKFLNNYNTVFKIFVIQLGFEKISKDFISINTFLENHNGPFYCLTDSIGTFSLLDSVRIRNIVSYMFPSSTSLEVSNGLPKSILLKKDNSLYRLPNKASSSSYSLRPMSIHDL